MTVAPIITVILTVATVAVAGCGPRQAIERGQARATSSSPAGVGEADVGAQTDSESDAGLAVPDMDPGRGFLMEDASPSEGAPADALADHLPAGLPDVTVVADAATAESLGSAAAPAPVATPATPIAGGWLRVAWAEAPDETDLSRLGQMDWVHWGHPQATGLNRKRGVSPRIEADTIGQRPVGGYDDREPEVSWSDGSPTAAARSRRGIVTGSDVGAGFLVRVPGPLAGVHRLTVQLGAWNARGLLQVRIDGQPALGVLDRRLRAEHPGRDQVAAIDFGPIDVGQTLLLQWTVADLDDPFGNVTLQAAALSALRTP